MRHSIFLISFLVLTTNLIAQKSKKKKGRDTAYTIVPLRDIYYNKTLIIEIGEKASIYLSGDSIVSEANKYLSNDFVKTHYNNIITFLDSAYKHGDTVSIEFYKLLYLEYLVSKQLQNGYAKVFYKRQNSFVDTISHRLERFGGHGDRFFYLPDQRPFFGVIEITGIIDNKAFFSGKYYQDYLKEGEKLLSIRLE